jgi:hypothetical protein
MRILQGNRGDSLRQGATGVVLIGGFALSGVAAILMLVFAMGGVFRGTYTREPLTNKITDAGTLNWVPLTFLFFCFGLILIVGAVVYGLYTSATERSGPRESHPVKVLAKYGTMLVAAWEIEGAENPRYYVRLDFGGNLGASECECSETVFNQCGEGMTGMAELNGKWLGSFVPYMGQHFRTEHIADDSHLTINRDV